jgi:alanine racemase
MTQCISGEAHFLTLQLFLPAFLNHNAMMSRDRMNLSKSSLSIPKRTWVEIDHAALRHNLKAVQKLAGKADIMAVVKANGYGHGLNEVARTFSPGVEIFAVASLGEALQLRNTEKKKPILLLSAALPSEYREIGRHAFIPTISSLHEARLFSKSAPKGSLIHFKVDSGMGRLGCRPEEAAAILAQLRRLPITLHSISTHLPSADSDRAFTVNQLKQFECLASSLRKTAPGIPIHVLNSAATMLFPGSAQDLVRVGLALYGISPLPRFQKQLRPALSWRAAVTFINEIPKGQGISYGGTYKAPRNLRVAVLPVGYGDGYPRQLSGKGAVVLIRGKKCPVLGRVTMDQIMVDISALKGAKVGDEAVLVGRQRKAEITATEVATKADTIPWHLFCCITARVAYKYKG